MTRWQSKRLKWIAPLMLIWALNWTGCAGSPQPPTATAAPIKAPLPLRPVLSAADKAVIGGAAGPVQRLFIKHELDWNGYADKMEAR